MICTCGQKLKCIDTRFRKKGAGTMARQYKCPDCDKRYTTVEQFIDRPGSGARAIDCVTPLGAAGWKRQVIERVTAALNEFAESEV